MKKIYIIAILLLTSIGAFAQEGSSLYNKWSDSEGVSAVYISPSMFKMIGKLPELNVELNDEEKFDVAPLIRSFSGFYLLDIENQDICQKLVADVKSMVGKGRYDLMMEMKDSGDNIQIFTAGTEKIIESLVFFARSEGEVQFICIDGTINRSDIEAIIAKASESMEL